ncbi:hypothetical protein K439DRAFT_1527767 [Ramaria rubella]|nr:hypothetical protein K439DRAFT_1527767 [Ramaria rubella]
MITSTPSDIFRFRDLGYDVQTYIITSFVFLQDIFTLSFVSRDVGAIAIQALYSDVRLLFAMRPDDIPTQHILLKDMQSSQHVFARQIIRHKERAQSVRSLTWQVCETGSSGINAFTDVFSLLDNVTKIHLINAHPTFLAERASFLRPHIKLVNKVISHTLFPRADDVTLTGTTSFSLIMPILHSPHRLTSLSFHTITPHSVALALLDWFSTADLSSLRHIALRTLRPMQDARRWNDLQEQELLLAWRTALSAVRGTVRSVTLGFLHKLSIDYGLSASSEKNRFAQFSKLVVPVFWEESWPSIETVRFEGSDFKTDIEICSSVARLQSIVPRVVIETTPSCVESLHSTTNGLNYE